MRFVILASIHEKRRFPKNAPIRISFNNKIKCDKIGKIY